MPQKSSGDDLICSAATMITREAQRCVQRRVTHVRTPMEKPTTRLKRKSGPSQAVSERVTFRQRDLVVMCFHVSGFSHWTRSDTRGLKSEFDLWTGQSPKKKRKKNFNRQRRDRSCKDSIRVGNTLAWRCLQAGARKRAEQRRG